MSEIPKKLDKEIRIEAKNRCGYCLGEQKYIFAWLEIEHIYPRAKGRTSEKENLWLACPFCNTFKGSHTHGTDPKTKRKVTLFNPRKQIWKNHFEFDSNRAAIIGKTICERATVNVLKINNDLALETRKHWVRVGGTRQKIDRSDNMAIEKASKLPDDFVNGHYRVKQKLGAGGMGEVYLADDASLERLAFCLLQIEASEKAKINYRINERLYVDYC